jgi:hypothetical protein
MNLLFTLNRLKLRLESLKPIQNDSRALAEVTVAARVIPASIHAKLAMWTGTPKTGGRMVRFLPWPWQHVT